MYGGWAPRSAQFSIGHCFIGSLDPRLLFFFWGFEIQPCGRTPIFFFRVCRGFFCFLHRLGYADPSLPCPILTISYIPPPPAGTREKKAPMGWPGATWIIYWMYIAQKRYSNLEFGEMNFQLSWPCMVGETLFIATILRTSRRRLPPIGNISIVDRKVGF